MSTASNRIGFCAAAVALMALTGCGVRGGLELPPEAKAAQTTAPASSGQGRPADAAPKPHQGFILDGLLR